MALYWEKPWSIAQESDLARFILPNPPIGVPQIISAEPNLSKRVELLYDKFRELNLNYAWEPWSNPRRPKQWIRHPEQIVQDKVGTCVDLALFFCAGCREARLVPWIVAMEGHVLAMVSLSYGLDEHNKATNRRAGDCELFKKGPCRNLPDVLERFADDRFIAVECTGFARYVGDDRDSLECRNRDASGYLSFEQARNLGKEILQAAGSGSHVFRAAIDLAVALETNEQEPESTTDSEPLAWRFRKVNQALRKSLRDEPLMRVRTPGLHLDIEVEARKQPKSSDADPDDKFDHTKVLEWMTSHKIQLAILCGPSGSGKSGFFHKLIAPTDADGACWLLLNLKQFSSVNASDYLASLAQDGAKPEDRIRSLAFLSQIPLDAGSGLCDLAAGGSLLLFIDGLNEVPEEKIRTAILNSVKWLLIKYPGTRCIISTRVLPTAWCGLWNDPPRVPGDLASLSIYDADFWNRPFFKDRMSTGNGGRREAATTLLEEYLKNQSRFSEQDLKALSRAAYRLYVPDRALSFSESKIVDALTINAPADSKDLWRRMQDASLVESTQRNNEQIWVFEHQTWQDFLAARHLAKAGPKEVIWTSEVLDAVTLQAASIEVLTMTLEQLSSETQGDAFLERVYNWNWRHAFTCLSVALAETAQTDRRWSIEIEGALMDLLKDKCADPVFKTRVDAQRIADLLDPLAGRRLPLAHPIPRWHERWRRLRDHAASSGPVDESCVAMIVDSHSVVGWTAANLLRRIGLGSRDAVQPTAQKFLRKFSTPAIGAGTTTIRRSAGALSAPWAPYRQKRIPNCCCKRCRTAPKTYGCGSAARDRSWKTPSSRPTPRCGGV